MDELTQMFELRAPIARYFGMRLSFNADGAAQVELPYNPNLDHSLGGIHGGVYATMLDVAGWFTAALLRKPSTWLATSELSIRYLEPVHESTLRAVGTIIKHGKRQDVVEMKLFDQEDQLVGYATGTFVVLSSVDMV
jgi:acyl-CoA thioesterase